MKLNEIENPPKMWWSGDQRVEPYMLKVSEVIDQNVSDKNKRTEIYNKAYEAIYQAIIDYSK